MANSDNVLRGGLTPKHVDVDELLSIVDTVELRNPVTAPLTLSTGVDGETVTWPSPSEEFVLVRHRVHGERVVTVRGPAVGIVTDGSLTWAGPSTRLELVRGQSLWVPASDSGEVVLSGSATLFVAAVP